WIRRSRAAVAAGDEAAGLALTGAVMCLVSPVTWVHHLVWLLPGLLLLVDHGMAAPPRSRRRHLLLAAATVGYGFLTSRIVWAWETDFSGVDGFLFGNAYVWISLALLAFLPLGRRGEPLDRGAPPVPAGRSAVEAAGVPQLDQPDRRTPAGERHRIGRLLTIR
ncbi:hypothetical protein EYA84_23320, partial [Verrucosispora sp. SN26_14.1]